MKWVKLTGKTGFLKETPPYFSICDAPLALADNCTPPILLEASHAHLLLLKNNYPRARVAAGVDASVPVDVSALLSLLLAVPREAVPSETIT